MGLESADFTPVPPRLSPDHFADERVAWDGAFPEDPQASLRIEAAALGGRPTSVRFFTHWSPREQLAPPHRAPGSVLLGSPHSPS